MVLEVALQNVFFHPTVDRARLQNAAYVNSSCEFDLTEFRTVLEDQS